MKTYKLTFLQNTIMTLLFLEIELQISFTEKLLSVGSMKLKMYSSFKKCRINAA